jgi:hypothetical protein
VVVKDTGIGVGRRRQPRREIGVLAQRGIDEDPAHRRQSRR